MSNNEFHNEITQEVQSYVKAYKDRQKRRQVVSLLGIITALIMSLALMLPALSLTDTDDDVCTIEEHIHNEDCYLEFICEADDSLVHMHIESCHGEAPLICVEAEGVYETTETQTQSESILICDIPEAHFHDDGCFDAPESICADDDEEHVHDDGCYDQPALNCSLEEGHTHSDGCYDEIEVTDEPEAAPVHTHDANCYGEPPLICTEENVHIHDENCYSVNLEPVCGVFEHIHDDDCTVVISLFGFGDGLISTADQQWNLVNFTNGIEIRNSQGQLVSAGGSVSGDDDYILRVTFRERVNFQFQYDGTGYLRYDLPEGIRVIGDTGYIVGDGGNVIGIFVIENFGTSIAVQFYNVMRDGKPAPANFIDYYLNAEFTIVITAQLELTGSSTEFDFGNGTTVNVTAQIGKSSIEKTASAYFPDSKTINYTVKITSASGNVYIDRYTDLAQRAGSFDDLWAAAGPVLTGANSEIRDIIVKGPDNSTIPLSEPVSAGLSADNPQQYEIVFGEPVLLAQGQSMTITYTMYLGDAIRRLYGNNATVPEGHEGEYSFNVHNQAIVNYNGDMTIKDDVTVQIRRELLAKAGSIVTGSSPTRIRWTITAGDGVTVLNGKTMTDTLGAGVKLPSPMTGSAYFYNRTGGPIQYRQGDSIGTAAASFAALPEGGGFTYTLPESPSPIYYVQLTFETEVDESVRAMRWVNAVVFLGAEKSASVATVPGIRLENWNEITCEGDLRITIEFYLGAGNEGSSFYLGTTAGISAPPDYNTVGPVAFLALNGYARNVQLVDVQIEGEANPRDIFRLWGSSVLASSSVPAEKRNHNIHYNFGTGTQTSAGVTRQTDTLRLLFGAAAAPTTTLSINTDYLKWPTNKPATVRFSFDVPMNTPMKETSGTLGDYLNQGYKTTADTYLYLPGAITPPATNTTSFSTTNSNRAKTVLGLPVTKNLVGTRGDPENGKVYFDYEVIWDGIRYRGFHPHESSASIFSGKTNAILNLGMLTHERFGPGPNSIFTDTFDPKLKYVEGSLKVTERHIVYPQAGGFDAWYADPENKAYAEKYWGTTQSAHKTQYDNRASDIAGWYSYVLNPQEVYWYSGSTTPAVPAGEQYIYQYAPENLNSTTLSHYSRMPQFNNNTYRYGWNGIRWLPAGNHTPQISGNKITVPLGSAGERYNGPLKISYTLELDEYPEEEIELKNNAGIDTVDRLTAGAPYSNEMYVMCGYFDDDLTVKFGSTLIDKKLMNNNAATNTNRASFEIVINPDGASFSPYDHILVKDTMGSELEFYMESFKVYQGTKNASTGQIVWEATSTLLKRVDSLPLTNPTMFTYAITGTNEVTMVLPNKKALRIVYDALVKGSVGHVAQAANSVDIMGKYHSDFVENYRISTLQGWGGGDRTQLELYKFDELNQILRLAGAEFAVYIGWKRDWGNPVVTPSVPIELAAYVEPSFTIDDWTFYYIPARYLATDGGTDSALAITNENGFVRLNSTFLSVDTVFALVEVKSPAGYQEPIPLDGNLSISQNGSITFFARPDNHDPFTITGVDVRTVTESISLYNKPASIGNISITGTKTIDGVLPSDFILPYFMFELTEVNIDPDNSVRLMFPQRKLNTWVDWDTTGREGTFTFDIYDDFLPGIYRFMITEPRDSFLALDGWGFDTATYIVEVEISANASGSLAHNIKRLYTYNDKTGRAELLKGENITEEDILFENTYGIKVEINKTWNGAPGITAQLAETAFVMSDNSTGFEYIINYTEDLGFILNIPKGEYTLYEVTTGGFSPSEQTLWVYDNAKSQGDQRWYRYTSAINLTQTVFGEPWQTIDNTSFGGLRLPNAGGRGSDIFRIAGVAIMLAAVTGLAAMALVRWRKNSQWKHSI